MQSIPCTQKITTLPTTVTGNVKTKPLKFKI